jgi:hypothetical protein
VAWEQECLGICHMIIDLRDETLASNECLCNCYMITDLRDERWESKNVCV